MGARGQLKLASSLSVVPASAPEGSVAAQTASVAPVKPKAILADNALSDTWDEVVQGLDDAGLLSAADGPTVELLVRHLLVFREASDEVLSVGIVVPDNHNSEKKNPAEPVMRMQSGHIVTLLDKMGMTWMARARTVAKPEKSGDANPFAGDASATG